MAGKSGWFVIAFKPHRGGLIRFDCATKKEADVKALELRERGFTDVETVKK